MPTRRSNFAIVAYEGKIYCIGGETSNVTGKWIACGITEVYDPATDSWTTKASMPVEGWYSRACVLGEKIFVTNGVALYMYDPLTDMWTARANIPNVSTGAFFVSEVNNKLVLISREFTTGNKCKPIVHVYDPNTNRWSEKSQTFYATHTYDNSSEGAIGTTTGIYAPEKIYVITSIDTSIYSPDENRWTSAKAMPARRTHFGVAVLDDILYIIGGISIRVDNSIDPARVLALNEQYVPIGYKLEAVPEQTNSDFPSSDESLNFVVNDDYYYVKVLASVIIVVVVAGLIIYCQKSVTVTKGKKEYTRRMIRTCINPC
jgi:N-acetylneuraminic acid mutarotase